MFGQSRSPVAAYAQVGVETAVHTASPHQLIALLFEAGRTALNMARLAMEQNKVDARGTAISKAIDIISNGLQVSLDLDSGGDLAVKLSALYSYMTRRLIHANINNDRQALDEVDGLLGEIQSAWIEIGEKVRLSSTVE